MEHKKNRKRKLYSINIIWRQKIFKYFNKIH